MRSFILYLIGLSLIIFFFIQLTYNMWKSDPVYTEPTPGENDIINLVNEARDKQGLYPYILDQNLCPVADKRSSEITANWSHDGFSVDIFPNKYTFVGENLAKDFMNHRGVINGWYNSPSHRDIMFSSEFKYICIGVTNYNNSEYIAMEVAR